MPAFQFQLLLVMSPSMYGRMRSRKLVPCGPGVFSLPIPVSAASLQTSYCSLGWLGARSRRSPAEKPSAPGRSCGSPNQSASDCCCRPSVGTPPCSQGPAGTPRPPAAKKPQLTSPIPSASAATHAGPPPTAHRRVRHKDSWLLSPFLDFEFPSPRQCPPFSHRREKTSSPVAGTLRVPSASRRLCGTPFGTKAVVRPRENHALRRGSGTCHPARLFLGLAFRSTTLRAVRRNCSPPCCRAW